MATLQMSGLHRMDNRKESVILVFSSLLILTLAASCDIMGFAWGKYVVVSSSADGGDTITLSQGFVCFRLNSVQAEIEAEFGTNEFCFKRLSISPDGTDTSCTASAWSVVSRCLDARDSSRALFFTSLLLVYLEWVVNIARYDLLDKTAVISEALYLTCTITQALLPLLASILLLVVWIQATVACSEDVMCGNNQLVFKIDVGIILVILGLFVQVLATISSGVSLSRMITRRQSPPPPPPSSFIPSFTRSPSSQEVPMGAPVSSPSPSVPPPTPQWQALTDPASGHIYFYNQVTRQSSWEPPSPSHHRDETRPPSLGNPRRQSFTEAGIVTHQL